MIDFRPKERFSDRADAYAQYRPSYPQALVDSIRRKLPDPSVPGLSAADVGSGTGIFSRLLIENGFTVYGVEPNVAMRQCAEEMLSPLPRFISVDGEAARTTLHHHSVDIVATAQAFHWFAIPETVTEFIRILKNPGFVVLIWNDRKRDSDEFHSEYESLLVRYALHYMEVHHRNVTARKIQELFTGWQLSVEHFDNEQVLDFSALKGRLESSSYCPPPDHPHYALLMDHLRDVFRKHCGDGKIHLQQDCVAYFLVR